MLEHAFDFFSLHRSHALHTLFRALLSLSDEGVVTWVVIVSNGKPKIGCWGVIQKAGLVGSGSKEVETELFMFS